MLVTLLKREMLRFRHLVRFSTTLYPFAATLKDKFTSVEEEKILDALNNTDSVILSGLLPSTRIKNLERYKSKNGSLTNINEMLEVDGFGVKNAEQLCKKIISNEMGIVPRMNGNGNKKVKSLLSPPLPGGINISNVVGIHISPTGVGWAEVFHEEDKLQSWGYEPLELLTKKILPTDTFQIALNILNQLPRGEIYVFEGNPAMSQGPKSSNAIASYTQQQELTAMLVALINTSPKHNTKLDKNGWINKIHFLKSKTPARLFKTLVGNETVSNVFVISQLIKESSTNSLTCKPLNLDPDLKNVYLNQVPPNRELMGHAILLTMAFVHLILRKSFDGSSFMGSNNEK